MADWKEREQTNVIGPDHPQPAAPSHEELAREGKAAVRSDAGETPRREAETPKPIAGESRADRDNPSRGMIDEGGEQR